MKKAAVIALAVIGLIVLPLRGQQPEPTSITWTNAGSKLPYCLTVLTVNNQPPTGIYAYCPNQSTEFALADGDASLYLPDSDHGEFGLILEGIELTLGNNIPLTYNPDGSVKTFQRTDTFSQAGWTGTTTQNYANQTIYGARNRKLNKIVYLGGSGTITEK
jgi:hypothetical protein